MVWVTHHNARSLPPGPSFLESASVEFSPADKAPVISSLFPMFLAKGVVVVNKQPCVPTSIFPMASKRPRSFSSADSLLSFWIWVVVVVVVVAMVAVVCRRST